MFSTMLTDDKQACLPTTVEVNYIQPFLNNKKNI